MALIQLKEGSQNTIFVIAVIKTTPNQPDLVRTIGWTVDVNDAIRFVRENVGGMSENGYYDLAVVEELGEGIYNHALQQFWFMWNEKKGYLPIIKPDRYKIFGRVTM